MLAKQMQSTLDATQQQAAAVQEDDLEQLALKALQGA